MAEKRRRLAALLGVLILLWAFGAPAEEAATQTDLDPVYTAEGDVPIFA